jgi:PqqD family protein of HPr-rel-A system
MRRVEMLALNDAGFAFDPMNGESFTLNETAVEIIKAMKKGKSEREIAEELSNVYDVEALDSLTDVLDFVKQLKMFRLVE